MNERIRHTPYYKKDLKFRINQLQPVLIAAETKEYDIIFDKEEGASNAAYDNTELMIKVISDLGLMHFNDVARIITAYSINPGAIDGIVNKINTKAGV